jgi:hypothetical protein
VTAAPLKKKNADQLRSIAERYRNHPGIRHFLFRLSAVLGVSLLAGVLLMESCPRSAIECFRADWPDDKTDDCRILLGDSVDASGAAVHISALFCDFYWSDG